MWKATTGCIATTAVGMDITYGPLIGGSALTASQPTLLSLKGKKNSRRTYGQ